VIGGPLRTGRRRSIDEVIRTNALLVGDVIVAFDGSRCAR